MDHGWLETLEEEAGFRFKDQGVPASASVDHISKQKKMVNSGVIGFYVYRAIGADGMPIYKIDPDSIVEVYGGFEVGKGKK